MLVRRCSIELMLGDITAQRVDAIVNAANPQLAGGGGVDGAIHRAAGPSLMSETREKYKSGCPVGSAVATSAGALHAQWVFHAVGPVYVGGAAGEAALLESAYRRCLELSLAHGASSVAFPAISCGVYGYPLADAARVALDTTAAFLVEHDAPSLVRFVLFSQPVLDAFAEAMQASG